MKLLKKHEEKIAFLLSPCQDLKDLLDNEVISHFVWDWDEVLEILEKLFAHQS